MYSSERSVAVRLRRYGVERACPLRVVVYEASLMRRKSSGRHIRCTTRPSPAPCSHRCDGPRTRLRNNLDPQCCDVSRYQSPPRREEFSRLLVLRGRRDRSAHAIMSDYFSSNDNGQGRDGSQADPPTIHLTVDQPAGGGIPLTPLRSTTSKPEPSQTVANGRPRSCSGPPASVFVVLRPRGMSATRTSLRPSKRSEVADDGASQHHNDLRARCSDEIRHTILRRSMSPRLNTLPEDSAGTTEPQPSGLRSAIGSIGRKRAGSKSSVSSGGSKDRAFKGTKLGTTHEYDSSVIDLLDVIGMFNGHDPYDEQTLTCFRSRGLDLVYP
ncbi:hypothetical protein MRB53_037288 [Persea americana]|nr:hypothetical protein MRB53_037288 [Persea americana]